MSAIILRFKEKVKKISPRALLISICVFVLSTVIINTVPMMVLKHSVREKGKMQVEESANQIAELGTSCIEKDQRVLITDEFSRITYDSAENGELIGKFLLIPEMYRAFNGEPTTSSDFEENGLVSNTVLKTGTGAIFVSQNDRDVPSILNSVQTALFIVALLVGIIIASVINFGALKTKRRVKTLITGISTNNQQIAVPGDDEIAELAGELNKLSRQILETEELRRTFVSDASHELRTPLSSIQLLVDSIIQTENIDMDTTREFMTDVSEQIDRLSRIAERLLILTNLDGAKDLPLESVDMKKVAESVIATLEQSANEADITLNCNFAEDVVFSGTSDGAYQIIFNLVENAIKYNRKGGSVRVYIFKNDGVCNLIVDDNGIGIPQADFDLIFERFYRVDKARSRDKGGSGLGLSIVSKIVGYFNGEIKVEPSVDGGTRFTVTFPEEAAK